MSGVRRVLVDDAGERLPANLLQAQRDYFGAHTYRRIDREAGSSWHTRWTDDQIEEPAE